MSNTFPSGNLLDESLTSLWVSIYLSIEIPNAEVKYQRRDAAHRFLISHEHRNFEVTFDESATAMEADDLVAALDLVVERVLSRTESVDINVSCTPVEHAEVA
jgi:hypothetical protein